MTMHRQLFRATALSLLIGLLPVHRLAAADKTPPLTGSLTTVNGVRVLKLWGTPRERGFAHGYLLGNEIMVLIESALLDPRTLKDPAQYEQGVLQQVLPRMSFRAEHNEEFDGMLAGVIAALGPEKTRLNRLGRNLSVQDLKAVNTLADWYTFFCSSFSAWGDLTTDGATITGRNLDFFTLPGLTEHHIVIANLEPGQGRKRWVSVAWPSLIGAYTSMNQDGVTVNIHDVQVPASKQPGTFVPRTFALRDAIETASAATAVDDVKKVLDHSMVMCGNNIHVSAPFTGQPVPAAVFEWDADTAQDGGATLRVSAVRGGAKLNQAVFCTNHHRLRKTPQSCNRYEEIESRLLSAGQEGQKLDVASAESIMKAVSVPGTLQSVIFLPNRREFYLRLATNKHNATDSQSVHFRLDDLLKKTP